MTLLFDQGDLPSCGRAGPSLMAAMTLVVAADRRSALTRLSPSPCHPTYDRLVRNGRVKQRSHINRRGRLRPRKPGIAGAQVIRSSLDASMAPPTAAVYGWRLYASTAPWRASICVQTVSQSQPVSRTAGHDAVPGGLRNPLARSERSAAAAAQAAQGRRRSPGSAWLRRTGSLADRSSTRRATWLMPPSTGMSAPVVKLLRSEARKSAAFATSSAVA